MGWGVGICIYSGVTDPSVKLGIASLTVPLGRLLSISKPVSLWLWRGCSYFVAVLLTLLESEETRLNCILVKHLLSSFRISFSSWSENGKKVYALRIEHPFYNVYKYLLLYCVAGTNLVCRSIILQKQTKLWKKEIRFVFTRGRDWGKEIEWR